MWASRRVLAVVATDLHLREEAPLSRAEKGEEWLAVQAGYLKQLDTIIAKFKCPLLIGGDVFHKWNPSPNLINFALANLPDCYAICGNHDLPYHDFNQRTKSAYFTLVMAKKITDMTITPIHFDNGLTVHPFPYSFPVGRLLPNWLGGTSRIHMALVHQYIWYGSAKYPDAPQTLHAAKFQGPLTGYDCAAFGDNHKWFSVQLPNGTNVMNCGGFYRSKSDERDMRPCVGVVCDDGKIYPRELDCSKDRWVDNIDEIKDRENEKEEDVRAADFLIQLAKLGDQVVNFKETVENFLKNAEVSDGARKIVLDAIGKE